MFNRPRLFHEGDLAEGRKTQYKLLIEDYMLKYDVSYTTATQKLAILYKLDAFTTDDIINNFNISML